jgi:hypothetical protein
VVRVSFNSTGVVDVQGISWRELLQQLSSFHRLWSLPTSGTVTDILSRIDDPQFIHIYSTAEGQDSVKRSSACSSTSFQHSSKAEERLRFHLSRFNLHFEVRPGSSKLRSFDYADYSIASPKSLKHALSAVEPELQKLEPLPLPLLFEDFLLLVSDNPTLPVEVLIRDAFTRHGSRVPASFAPKMAEANIQHHVYTFHPYTRNLETAEVASRLHLSALHAHCSCSVPLPGLA